MSSKSSLTSKTFGKISAVDATSIKIGSTSKVTLKKMPAPVTIATGNATLTAAQVLAGTIVQTPAANSTLTLPTAAILVATFPRVAVGDAFEIRVMNLAAATYTTTVGAGSGNTIVGTAVAQPLTGLRATVRFTSVGSGSEACTVYFS